jgi:hypothetical protein
MTPRFNQWHGAALLLYALGAWVFLDHGVSLTHNVLGLGADPSLIMWFLSWWPWALNHHALALQSHLMWQPQGLNLGWTTSVPLLALLVWPITWLGGALLSFNLLTLAAPFLAAFTAYLLCLEIFGVPLAAVIGGWLFGFSAYESAQTLDHLNLDFTVLIPLILLVLLRRVKGKAQRLRTVFWLAIFLAAQFLISEEIFATFVLFGGIGFVLAFALLPAYRGALRALAVDGLCALPVVLLLVSPLLIAMLTGPYDVAHPAKWPHLFSNDLLNVLLPTQATALGGALAAPVTRRFTGGLDEQSGYLGLPVILLLVAAAREFWQDRRLRILFLMLGVLLVASLGPRLMVAGYNTGIVLPWAALLHLPLLGAALPARVMLYATLVVAIIVAGWVAQGSRQRYLLGVVACLSLVPVLHPASPSPALEFFRPGRVEAVLGPSPRLLILPFGIAGQSSYWQAENGFGFTQVGGYLGFPPKAQQAYPAVMQMFLNTFFDHFPANLAAYCQSSGAQYVIATPGTVAGEWAALRSLGWPAQKVDDVTIFTVPRA